MLLLLLLLLLPLLQRLQLLLLLGVAELFAPCSSLFMPSFCLKSFPSLSLLASIASVENGNVILTCGVQFGSMRGSESIKRITSSARFRTLAK